MQLAMVELPVGSSAMHTGARRQQQSATGDFRPVFGAGIDISSDATILDVEPWSNAGTLASPQNHVRFLLRVSADCCAPHDLYRYGRVLKTFILPSSDLQNGEREPAR